MHVYHLVGLPLKFTIDLLVNSVACYCLICIALYSFSFVQQLFSCYIHKSCITKSHMFSGGHAVHACLPLLKEHLAIGSLHKKEENSLLRDSACHHNNV